MFTTLMGEKVEPRKLFIQEHARTVRNLTSSLPAEPQPAG